MNIEVKKWNPWNWSKHEDEEEAKRAGGAVQSYARNPLQDLHKEIDRLFENSFKGLSAGFPNFSNFPHFSDFFEKAPGAVIKPSVDIRENKKNYIITAEIPGVNEEDIKLEVSDYTLTISGEKKSEKEEKDEHYQRLERSYGSFRRVLSLPEDAQGDNAEASFKKGVLTITVPRQEAAKSKDKAKLIQIKHAA